MRSDTTIKTVSVIHLIGKPFKIEFFQQFISSYKKFQSGYEHQLIFLFNGFENESATFPFDQFASGQGLNYTSYYNQKGADLEAYFWLAPQLKAGYVLFMNSYSELLSENWLLKYMSAASIQENFGVVSATASYQSYYSTLLLENSWMWNRAMIFSENFKKYKLLIKTILLYRFYFDSFPNPHIRTTAFLINRELFLSLNFTRPKNKFKAYLFESGKKGFTKQLLKRKLAVSVIDKDGNLYAIPEWYQSKTFWTKNQENLLVSDNQTMNFQAAGNTERKKFTFKAWGIYE